jgi:hypothetical protein
MYPECTDPSRRDHQGGEDGQIRRFINFYVNEEDIRFLGNEKYLFQEGDEVLVIPSIAGGAPSAACHYSRIRVDVPGRTSVKWLFPIRGPHRQVLVCGVEVKAALHNFRMGTVTRILL